MTSHLSRYQTLSAQFQLGQNTHIDKQNIDIRFYPFKSQRSFTGVSGEENTFITSDDIAENQVFEYPVFVPSHVQKHDEAILLLHGLNERNWSKYLPWAEKLCAETGKVVILFPIAYHINRAPSTWSNPRFLQKILEFRRKLFSNDRSISFANVALSERLTQQPQKFYSSGRQSFDDIVKLITEIKAGKHPLLTKNANIDIFAYSIGAFLSQILLLANPEGYFSDTKLFMFCGGSVFNTMYGESRSIMDKSSYEVLLKHYQTGFWAEEIALNTGDSALAAFYSMIGEKNNQTHRTTTFETMCNRIKGISLASDKVIPYQGVEQALGHNNASKTITQLDFPYTYTHENPFPINSNTDQEAVDFAFKGVFERAVGFLG